MVRSRIRVLHVINNLATGGAESMLVRLALSLREEFDQFVSCILDRGALAPCLEAAGIQVDALGVSARLPNPLATMALARRIRAIRPDIVQTWLYQSDLLGGVAARMAGVPSVVWNIRSADLSPGESPLLTRSTVKLCAALSSRLPTQIVVCAQSAADVHRRLGYDTSKMVVIQNGVDLDRFRPDLVARSNVRGELGLPQDAFVIGQIARLHPQKDHETFFAAARLLRQTLPDVQFLLAGQRVTAAEHGLVELLRRHGLTSGIHLLGERHDVHRLCAAMDVASSASAWGEGFPNALCEAMACGVPCVATDAGDARLIIGDTGRIVARRDPSALAQGWIELLALDAESRQNLGRCARERAVSLFDQRLSTERYAQLYRRLGRVS